MEKKKKLIIDILIVMLLCIMVFSGWKLYSNYKRAQDSENRFKDLESVLQQKDDNGNEEIYYLTAAERYRSVYEMNNHFTGWVKIGNTPVNYPVVLTPDSPEYYLRRDFSGKYSEYGVPFMDYRNTPDKNDNTIVYAHNMKNGTMFSAVESYTNKSFWQEHPYVEFDTLNGYGVYEVICVFRIDVNNSEFYFNQYLDFADAAEFSEYIANAKAMAPYDTGVTATYGDKLLTLSTCEYTYENGRCVLLAKKIDAPAVKAFDADGNVIKDAAIPEEYLQKAE